MKNKIDKQKIKEYYTSYSITKIIQSFAIF